MNTIPPTAQRQMNIIAFCARKGGCGKTTSAASLAICADQQARLFAEAGAPPPLIALIDLDPQGCLTKFFNQRDPGGPGPALVETSLRRLATTLNELESMGYTEVFLDCPPGHGAVVDAAMRAATLVIIPCKPSELDLEATKETVQMAVAVGAPYRVLLNDGTFRTRSMGAARTALLSLDLPLLSVVHHRVDTMLSSGLTVTERLPGSTAAAEIMRAHDAMRGVLRPCPI